MNNEEIAKIKQEILVKQNFFKGIKNESLIYMEKYKLKHQLENEMEHLKGLIGKSSNELQTLRRLFERTEKQYNIEIRILNELSPLMEIAKLQEVELNTLKDKLLINSEKLAQSVMQEMMLKGSNNVVNEPLNVINEPLNVINEPLNNNENVVTPITPNDEEPLTDDDEEPIEYDPTRLNNLLVHISTCKEECDNSGCKTLKERFLHLQGCQIRPRGECGLCDPLYKLIKVHSDKCDDENCNVYLCSKFKNHKGKRQRTKTDLLDPSYENGKKSYTTTTPPIEPTHNARKGVTMSKEGFMASMMHDGERFSFGPYPLAEDAARVYDDVKRWFGGGIKDLNFPDDLSQSVSWVKGAIQEIRKKRLRSS